MMQSGPDWQQSGPFCLGGAAYGRQTVRHPDVVAPVVVCSIYPGKGDTRPVLLRTQEPRGPEHHKVLSCLALGSCFRRNTVLFRRYHGALHGKPPDARTLPYAPITRSAATATRVGVVSCSGSASSANHRGPSCLVGSQLRGVPVKSRMR
jgi:hypothetical protein